MELREQLQDYVIAHEILYFHVPNHGRLWKSLMHLGEHEQLELELRRVRLGGGLPAAADR